MFKSLYVSKKLDSTLNESDAAHSNLFTKITSDLLDFDYGKLSAVFEKNVVSVHPQLTLKCNMMKVFFEGKNFDVIRVEAYNDVHLFQNDKEAVGDKAVFTKETGMVLLSGTKSKLKDEKGNWVISRGDGITYDTNSKQMKVDKPSMEVSGPSR
jgi:lipopolysaccharide export system protein LptA